MIVFMRCLSPEPPPRPSFAASPRNACAASSGTSYNSANRRIAATCALRTAAGTAPPLAAFAPDCAAAAAAHDGPATAAEPPAACSTAASGAATAACITATPYHMHVRGAAQEHIMSHNPTC